MQHPHFGLISASAAVRFGEGYGATSLNAQIYARKLFKERWVGWNIDNKKGEEKPSPVACRPLGLVRVVVTGVRMAV